MSTAQKFTFDQLKFDSENSEINSPKSYELGRKAGYDEGYALAKSEDENAIAAMVQQVSNQMGQLTGQYLQTQNSLKQEVLKTSYAITSRLFPFFSDNGGYKEIMFIVEEALKDRPDELVYTITVNEDLVELTTEKIQAYAAVDMADGKIKVVGDPDLAKTDCRVAWNTGGLERMLSRLQAEIDVAVTRLVPKEDLKAAASDQSPPVEAAPEVEPEAAAPEPTETPTEQQEQPKQEDKNEEGS